MEKQDNWIIITEFPQYEISTETGKVRRRESIKVHTHQYFDLEGNLLSEFSTTTNVPAKELTNRKGSYALAKNGKMFNRCLKGLYRKYVTKEPQISKKYRKKKTLKF